MTIQWAQVDSHRLQIVQTYRFSAVQALYHSKIAESSSTGRLAILATASAFRP